MTDETAAAPTEDRAEAKPKSLVASFTQADAKLLITTFAGGLAANVGLVFVVALGLLLAHALKRDSNLVHQLPQVQGVISGVLAIGTTATGNSRRGRIARRITLGFIGVAAAITTLALVGYAAGVK
jgi:hypothetical protein